MQRAGGRCSRPDCRRETLGPSESIPIKGQILGEAAHIRAASPGGARYDETQSDDLRHSVENGIWLCVFCASLVDKDNGADYSVEQLHTWKIAAERAALERLLRRSDSVRDNCVRSLIFINVPRLWHYVSLSEPNRSLPLDFIHGIPSEGYIAPELYQLGRAIERLHFPALDWREAINVAADPTGMLVSFEGRFWTKNGPRGRNDREERDFTNLKTVPHVYTKNGSTKFILPYDPRYVTTTTATVEFNSGQIRIGGFGLIKYRNRDEVVATPYLIGLASTPQARAFWDAMAAQ